MRRFELHRDVDASGVSGTGVVADGVQFHTGQCVLCWRTATTSIAVYRTAAELEHIHGHGGATRIVWLDPQGAP